MKLPKLSLAIVLTMMPIVVAEALTDLKKSTLHLSLSVEPDRATKRILLKWSLKNVSNVEVTVTRIRPLTDYRVEVTDERGKRVPLTERGPQRIAACFYGFVQTNSKAPPGAGTPGTS